MLFRSRRTRCLQRRFQQAGIDPAIFDKPEENMVLVVANVPDQRMSIVQEGQSCSAQIYGYPGQTFNGHVERIGATVHDHSAAKLRSRHLPGCLETPKEDDLRQDVENLAVLRRFAINIIRAHPARISMRQKVKRAGWDDTFLLDLLSHMR